MSTTEIERELCRFVAENILDADVAVDETTVLAQIGIDSFSLMEIVLFIERQFGVTLPDNALTPENLASIHAIASCIATHRGTRS